VSCEIAVDNNCLQYANSFKYLGSEISYESDKDIQQKLAEFAQVLGILNNVFKPTLVLKFSRIEVQNSLPVPILLYGSEIWTLRGRGKGIRNNWHPSE
jgi:hypothetical protein